MESAETFSLIDDAFLKTVFTFLPLRDLCNAAEACKRFKVIADETFKTIYAGKPLDVLTLIDGDKYFHKEWFMVRSLTDSFLKSAEQLFRNFGSFIEALRLTGTGESYGMDENDLLILAKRYCLSVKELTLYALGNDDHFSTELLALFRRIEKLNVLNDFGDDLSESFAYLLSDCHNLKYLNVVGVSGRMWMSHTFPELDTLIMSNGWDFDDDLFETFLKTNKNLRSLTYDSYSICPSFFAILSTASPQLETFNCNIDCIDFYANRKEVEENVLQLSKLRSLKNLTFTCETSTLNVLVAALNKEDTPIEHLVIAKSRLDAEIIVGLSKLKTMKSLKLTQCKITTEALNNVNHCFNRLDKVIIADIKGFELVDRETEFSFTENVIKILKKLPKKSLKRPREDSDNILYALNDDCLVEIFKFLTLPDLCNVADVCKIFRENAQRVFQSRHTAVKTAEISKHGTDMLLAERLFRNFGVFIQELGLDGYCLRSFSDHENLIHLAAMYCDPLTLRTLNLDRIFMDYDMRWILPNLRLFLQLISLELRSCRINANFGRFLSECRIPTIQASSMYDPTAEWMSHTFRHLRRLIIFDTWQSESSLNKFIKRNKHLLQLAIHGSMFSSKIFKTVTKHMPHLVEFYCSGTNVRDREIRKNVLKLAELKELRSLTLNCGTFSVKHLIDEFVKVSTPLCELNICFGNVDMDLLEKLGNIKTPLTAVQFRRVNMKKVSLIDVAKKLPNLKELEIDIKGIVAQDVINMLPFAESLIKLTIASERLKVQIDTEVYQSILRIVKSREKVTKLSIVITSPHPCVLVPKHLLWQNSYWLQIDNKIYENLSTELTNFELEISEQSDESDSDSDISDIK